MKKCKVSKNKFLNCKILVCSICPTENMYFLAKKMIKEMCKECLYK